jgi:tetratricopeptide (TPR) repeat protein
LAKEKDSLGEDLFLNFISQSVEYLKNNKKLIRRLFYIIGGICVVIFVIYSYLNGQRREAETLYKEALRIYGESKNEEGYKKAKENFIKASKFTWTKASKLSLLYAGNCCYHLKEYKDALKYYKMFVERFQEYPLTFLGYISLANTAEEIDNIDEAIKSYKEVINLYPKKRLTAYAKIRLAKCYQEKKEINKAKALLREVLEKFKDTQWEEKASFYLNILDKINKDG